jgi:hypothetical protein
MSDPPNIDSRTAPEIEDEVRRVLLRFIAGDPEWAHASYIDEKTTGALAALIAVFGRFAETVIRQLNCAPHKNFLAFLDLLGVSRLYPQAARVPLTFSLATGSLLPAVVKERTQVSAQPAKNQTSPSIYETERELVVSPVRLVAAYMMHHGLDHYYSWQADEKTPAVLEFRGMLPVEHILYLGFAILETPQIAEIELHIVLEKPAPEKRTIQWEAWTGAAWTILEIIEDTTTNLSGSGSIRFRAVPVLPSTVNEIENRWIRARLATAIEGAAETPSLCSVGMRITGKQTELLKTTAFAESQPVDLTRDFFPFGMRPAFGATFYISNPQAFVVRDAVITIQVDLTNPASGGAEPPIPRTNVSGTPVLSWEYWDGRYWSAFGISEIGKDSNPQFPEFEDTTRAFTKSGYVRFRFAQFPKPIRVGGVEALWIRIRLIRGDYGTELAAVPVPPERAVSQVRVSPPSIHSLRFELEVRRASKRAEKILDWNDFKWTDQTSQTACFQPFRSDKNLPVAMYFGFDPPHNLANPFGSRSISMYLDITATAADSDAAPPSVSWQYWAGMEWKKWTVRDETEGLSVPAPVRFLPPSDFAVRSLFGKSIFWLRSLWMENQPEVAPVRRVLMNTVLAVNEETVAGELLGSSNGDPGQTFRTLRAPVLDRPVVEVRATQPLTAHERAEIERQEGPGAIRQVTDSLGQVTEIWVRWHEVPDFLESGKFDFHYVMDHIHGEVHFGDNARGVIPPAGPGNIRASYRTGGGAAGNRKPGEIVALKTTVPYVDKVSNHLPAEGGVDAEQDCELVVRGPRILRHRNRAVSREDYEDMAMVASREVGRALCVPLRHLKKDPDGRDLMPGVVSIIIVPRSHEKNPFPSPLLLETVSSYLDSVRVPTAEICVLGPEYVRIDVAAEIAIESLDAGDVELAVVLALNRFLHPLHGGFDRNGWEFGRRLHASELYTIIERIPGVRYISSLEINEHEDRAGTRLTGTFLIYSGQHQIRLFLPED